MPEVRYSDEEHVDAPPEAMFEYRLDYERTLPEYNPNVSNIVRTDGGTLVTFEVTLSFPEEMAGIAEMAEHSGREQVRLELELMKKALES